MPWVKIDDHIDEHPKFARVGPLGLALQVAGLAYCNRQLTDGFVPRSVAHRLLDWRLFDDRGNVATIGITTDHGDTGLGSGFEVDSEFVIGLLLDAGIWVEVEGGFRIHDYGNYQPSAKEVLSDRDSKHEAKVRAGRKGAEARWGKAKSSSAIADAKQTDNPVPVPVPLSKRSRALAESDSTPAPSTELAAAPKSSPPARAPDPVFEALCAIDGIDWHRINGAERGRINGAARLIREGGYSALEIEQAAKRWPEVFGDATVTAQAVARNLQRLLNGPGRARAPTRDRAAETAERAMRGEFG